VSERAEARLGRDLDHRKLALDEQALRAREPQGRDVGAEAAAEALAHQA
jgi:hypothetical protein